MEIKIGQKIGRWTVLQLKTPMYLLARGWEALCRCDCGTERWVNLKSLKDGRTKSCGHCKLNALIGKRFGRLTVLRIENGRALCRCDCGKEKYVNDPRNLRNGFTRSCGCLRRENIRKQHEEYLRQ